MPEIAEVARIVHFLRKKLVGRTIAHVSAVDDENIFGKVGTSGAAVESALKGRRIVSAGSQGKYFWICLDKPPHLLMHFGMTGWMHIKGERTAYTNYYKKQKDGESEQWPPKFCKFHLSTDDKPAVETAFTDARRFARVRLIDCPGNDIRKHSPLKENGPDPVVDVDVFTKDYLRGKMRSRHVPVKALILDQATISGIGNWVADETLYHARLHPEQYCDEFNDAQIAKLYESLRYVCQTAVDALSDSDDFPEHWLFNYRWCKGDKGAPLKLPNGEQIAFITVGGRTSCYAPNLQKKTGRVAAGAAEEPAELKPSEKADGMRTGEAQKRKKSHKAAVKGRDLDHTNAAKRKKSAKMKDEEKSLIADGSKDHPGRRRSARLKS